MIGHIAAMCETADLLLDEVAPDALLTIRANAVDRADLAELMADLKRFRGMGRRRCRIGVIGGKLAAMPAV